MLTTRIGFTAVLTGFLLAVAVATVGNGQSRFAATANIPFEFFLDDERMPGGDYAIRHTSSGILLFHNAKTGATKQTFTARYGDPVEAKDARLIFVLYKEQYRFVGLRAIDGTWRVTAHYYTALPDGASRHEIPLTYSEPRKYCAFAMIPGSDQIASKIMILSTSLLAPNFGSRNYWLEVSFRCHNRFLDHRI